MSWIADAVGEVRRSSGESLIDGFSSESTPASSAPAAELPPPDRGRVVGSGGGGARGGQSRSEGGAKGTKGAGASLGRSLPAASVECKVCTFINEAPIGRASSCVTTA